MVVAIHFDSSTAQRTWTVRLSLFREVRPWNLRFFRELNSSGTDAISCSPRFGVIRRYQTPTRPGVIRKRRRSLSGQAGGHLIYLLRDWRPHELRTRSGGPVSPQNKRQSGGSSSFCARDRIAIVIHVALLNNRISFPPVTFRVTGCAEDCPRQWQVGYDARLMLLPVSVCRTSSERLTARRTAACT